jgi:hypothetical protein
VSGQALAPKQLELEAERYRDFDKSTLTSTVTHGWQVEDIELEP